MSAMTITAGICLCIITDVCNDKFVTAWFMQKTQLQAKVKPGDFRLILKMFSPMHTHLRKCYISTQSMSHSCNTD